MPLPLQILLEKCIWAKFIDVDDLLLNCCSYCSPYFVAFKIQFVSYLSLLYVAEICSAKLKPECRSCWCRRQ